MVVVLYNDRIDFKSITETGDSSGLLINFENICVINVKSFHTGWCHLFLDDLHSRRLLLEFPLFGGTHAGKVDNLQNLDWFPH